jgi:hypothetical protein
MSTLNNYTIIEETSTHRRYTTSWHRHVIKNSVDSPSFPRPPSFV